MTGRSTFIIEIDGVYRGNGSLECLEILVQDTVRPRALLLDQCLHGLEEAVVARAN